MDCVEVTDAIFPAGAYCKGYWVVMAFEIPCVVLFMGMGGELVVAFEGATENAISHWL